jgi:hypothetical protein
MHTRSHTHPRTAADIRARAVTASHGIALGVLLGVAAGTAACTPPVATPASGVPALGSSTATPRNQPWPLTFEPQALPLGSASAQPQLTASADGVILSWLETRDDTATLKFSERSATGWSEARSVATGRDWFVSWADVPSVLRLRDGTLVAQWLKAVDLATEAYDIRVSTSRDEGRTWTRPFAPHRDGTRTQHGFVSLFEWPASADARSDLGLIWLDGRNQALKANETEGGAMGLRYARFDVRAPAPRDTPRADGPVDDRVCECCPTSVAVTSDGVIAAFRDRSPREIRDIHTTRFENGAWTPPTPVHVDNWDIESCPVNGPAIAAQGRTVVVAWFTVTDDTGHANVAFSGDAGRTWGQAIQVDDRASRGQVDVELLDDGSAAVTWIEFEDQRSRFKVRRVDAAGARSEALEITAGPGAADAADARRVSGIPRLAKMGNDLIFAWAESQSGGADDLNIKGAVARFPRTTAQ